MKININRFKSKVGMKIIGAIIACTFFVALMVGIVSINRGISIITVESNGRLYEMAKNEANEFNNTITRIQALTEGMSSSVVGIVNKYKFRDPLYMDNYMEQLRPIIKNIAINSETLGVYMTFNTDITQKVYQIRYADENKDGNYMPQTTEDLSEFYEDNEKMEWYYKPIKQCKGVWGKPYFDSTVNTTIITYSMPVYVDDLLVGVAGIDLDFQQFQNDISNIQIYESGYAYIVDEDFNFVVHKTYTADENLSKVENGKLSSVVNEMWNNADGVTTYEVNGKKYMCGFSKLKDGHIFVICAPYNEIYKGMYNLVIIIGLIIVLGIILSLFVALFIGEKISAPLLSVTELVNKTSDLDLIYNKNFENAIKYKDETGIIGQAVINLRKEIRHIVSSIIKSSNNITEYTDKLDISTNETVRSIEIISSTIEELTAGAAEQAEQSQNGVEKLNSLADEIKTSVNDARKVEKYSNKTLDITNKGMDAVNILSQKLNDNNQSTKLVANNINELSNKSEVVGNITSTIQAIASETNLLALNAAIEAARAGEHGKGFAVVAEEIRNLSEQTSYSAKQIEAIIVEIQKEMSTAKYNMDDAKVTVQEANKSMINCKEAFEDISEAVKKSIKYITQLVENVDKVNKDKDVVVNVIQEISAISEESAASVQEVSASIEEESAAMDSIYEMVKNLKNISINLNELVEKFKI